MTEREWADSEHVLPMLVFASGRASPRQLRLFACACCRLPSVWRLLPEQSREVVRIAERFARGIDPFDRLERAAALARDRQRAGHWFNPVRLSPSNQAARAARQVALADASDTATSVVREAQNLVSSSACVLLREFVRYPPRPVLCDPILSAWGDGVIPRLAREIDEEGSFEQMTILGDALEDAGADPELVSHCHSGKPHLPGCWVIELILGRS